MPPLGLQSQAVGRPSPRCPPPAVRRLLSGYSVGATLRGVRSWSSGTSPSSVPGAKGGPMGAGAPVASRLSLGPALTHAALRPTGRRGRPRCGQVGRAAAGPLAALPAGADLREVLQGGAGQALAGAPAPQGESPGVQRPAGGPEQDGRCCPPPPPPAPFSGGGRALRGPHPSGCLRQGRGV